MSDDNEKKDTTKNNVGPEKPKVVPIRDRMAGKSICEKHRAELEASGLGGDTIAAMHAYCEYHPPTIAKMINWSKFGLGGHVLAFGYVPPGKEDPEIFRVKPERPRSRLENGKTKITKYEGPKGLVGGTPPYFPASVRNSDKLRDDSAVYLTEGEKKTELLAQLGYTAIGFGGVWAFHDVTAKQERNEWRMHPLFAEHVRAVGRSFVIVFDSDSRDNDSVVKAAKTITACLIRAGAVSVKFINIPQPDEKKVGIDDYCVEFGPAKTRELLASGHDIEPADLSDPLAQLYTVKALKTVPKDWISKQARMPEGYEFDNDGALWKNAQDDKHSSKRVTTSPVLIVRYVDDYYTGQGRVEVCWRVDNRWVKYLVDRRAIADRGHMLAELTPLSAPITSGTAPAVVDWIEALEAANRGKFDRAVGLARAGWHTIDPGGVRVFVLGDVLAADGAALPKLALDDRGDRKRAFAALTPKGDATKHVEALKKAWAASPIAAMLIAGAFAAPLLEIIDAPNFAIHLPGDSSKGKTSMLKVAASVFGDPNNEQWVASWNTTAVAAELRAASLSGLPLCFDEVGAADKGDIERLVYMLINGGGRSRGNRDLQLRETHSWRTILLSTGEHQLAEDDANTGAQVRVLQFSVQGFGALDAKGVDSVREACIDNCGHAGRAWVEHLLELGEDEIAEWRKHYREATDYFRARAGTALLGRQAAYFALLWLAETRLAAAIGLGSPTGSAAIAACTLAMNGDATVNEVRPLAERALDVVWDWVAQEPNAWLKLGVDSDGHLGATVSAGQRTIHGYHHKGTLLIIPGAFKTKMREIGYSPQEVKRTWRDQGWLKVNGTRTDVSVRVNGHIGKFIALTKTLEATVEA